jgi:hypothetical protein
MLDIMEMRGFKIDAARGLYLITPDGFHFAVQLFPHITPVTCTFSAFETLNDKYP